MLYKAYMSRRSDLEAECIFPLSDRVSFATRSGPTARRSSNFEHIAICNEDCPRPLTEAIFQYHALWAWIFIWFNGETWNALRAYGVTTNIAYCQSWLSKPDLLKEVGLPVWGTPDVLLGWVYWGGRDPFGPGTGTNHYVPPKKTSDYSVATSLTLMTCTCFDSRPYGWSSWMPHVRGSALVLYDPGANQFLRQTAWRSRGWMVPPHGVESRSGAVMGSRA